MYACVYNRIRWHDACLLQAMLSNISMNERMHVSVHVHTHRYIKRVLRRESVCACAFACMQIAKTHAHKCACVHAYTLAQLEAR
jgi:hypothetical protein